MATSGLVNFSGLMSGLDTQNIIEQLMQVDSRPLKRLENSKTKTIQKRDTFTTMKSNLTDLQDKAYNLKNASSFNAFSASSSDEEALTVNATSSANAGNYTIKILSLAQTETLSGDSYQNIDSDLGFSGSIVINNNSLKVKATNSLLDIRNAINDLDAGVSASILKVTESDYRLILSSETSGAEGFSIANVGDTDILGQLGLVDDTKSVREISNGAVLSNEFASALSTIGSMIGVSSNVSGTVSIRNKSITIDLSSDTLTTVRDKINSLGLSGVSASVGTVTDNGVTTYRLEIEGTEDFTDDSNVLEAMGILERGTSGTYAEFQTTQLFTDNGGSVEADGDTKLTKLGAVEGETITIGGTNLDGSTVTTTYTIEKNAKIEDLVSFIESAFDNNVIASIQDGRIHVRSAVDGTNDLSFSISALNDSGGELDFGTISTVTEGRDRLLSAGEDSQILINNVKVSRSTNEVSDVLTGLSLTLKKEDPDTVINITVENDVETVRGKIEDFVDAFNEIVDYVEENSNYNDETGEAGPLLGDQTTRSVMTRIRNVLQGSVYGDDFEFNQLIEIGIETKADGRLSIDSAKLNEALNEDMDSVKSLFTATRNASDNDIQFIYHTNNSKAGTYDVTITRAAEQARVSSNAFEGAVGESGTLTVTDNYGSTMNIDITDDMTADDIVNLINEEAETTYNEIRRFSGYLLENGGAIVSQSTAVQDIAGVEVSDGDTITIMGTDRDGRTFQRSFSRDVGETTIGDILDGIEDLNDGGVVASIDADGRIRVEEREAGASNLDITIETTISGLNFGTFDVIQEGRNKVIVDASLGDDGGVVLTHRNYGSTKTFTVSGGAFLGIEDADYAGVDVEGSINGSVGTGSGRALKSSTDNDNTRGMVINVTMTAEELEQEGQSQGTITLVSGIGDLLYGELTSITNSVNGFVQAKIDSIELSLDNLDSRIENMNNRLDQRRQSYIRKFTQLEMQMARLQSIQQQLSSSLSSLPSVSFFS